MPIIPEDLNGEALAECSLKRLRGLFQVADVKTLSIALATAALATLLSLPVEPLIFSLNQSQ